MRASKEHKPQQSRVIRNEPKNHIVQMQKGKRNENFKDRRARYNERKTAEQDGIRRGEQFRHNWKKLNYRDYIAQHNLTLSRSGPDRSSPGKLILRVTDGSIIIVDVKGKYWRHESATVAGAYYDINHIINPNNEQTHFSLI